MSRIRPLRPDEVAPETRATFDRFYAQRGAIPNMFRTMALRPEIMASAEAHMNAVFNTGTVDPRLKEMLAVRVSQINDCMYCCASHTALAKHLGASEELLDAMYNIDQHRDMFTPAERAALTLAERMTTDAHGVNEDVWADLQANFDDGQIVELAAVIGLFNYFNRFNNLLQMEPTKPNEGATPEREKDSKSARQQVSTF